MSLYLLHKSLLELVKHCKRVCSFLRATHWRASVYCRMFMEFYEEDFCPKLKFLTQLAWFTGAQNYPTFLSSDD